MYSSRPERSRVPGLPDPGIGRDARAASLQVLAPHEQRPDRQATDPTATCRPAVAANMRWGVRRAHARRVRSTRLAALATGRPARHTPHNALPLRGPSRGRRRAGGDRLADDRRALAQPRSATRHTPSGSAPVCDGRFDFDVSGIHDRAIARNATVTGARFTCTGEPGISVFRGDSSRRRLLAAHRLNHCNPSLEKYRQSDRSSSSVPCCPLIDSRRPLIAPNMMSYASVHHCLGRNYHGNRLNCGLIFLARQRE